MSKLSMKENIFFPLLICFWCCCSKKRRTEKVIWSIILMYHIPKKFVQEAFFCIRLLSLCVLRNLISCCAFPLHIFAYTNKKKLLWAYAAWFLFNFTNSFSTCIQRIFCWCLLGVFANHLKTINEHKIL